MAAFFTERRLLACFSCEVLKQNCTKVELSLILAWLYFSVAMSTSLVYCLMYVYMWDNENVVYTVNVYLLKLCET